MFQQEERIADSVVLQELSLRRRNVLVALFFAAKMVKKLVVVRRGDSPGHIGRRWS
jgi:hypothetical protein